MEVMPFATVDWIWKFPAITKGYQDRLIMHFNALFDALHMHMDMSHAVLGDATPKNNLYDTAKHRIKLLKVNDMMTAEEYTWHTAKFEQEHIASVAKQQEMETWMMVKAAHICLGLGTDIGVPVDPSLSTPVHSGASISEDGASALRANNSVTAKTPSSSSAKDKEEGEL
ncbi:hypothetical protein EI94DRAFT_1704833 [Lactarius quietus]|nr:hypothetical protein EI94DRAFT_1704833 [Lactarius quietus]